MHVHVNIIMLPLINPQYTHARVTVVTLYIYVYMCVSVTF